MRPPPLGKQRPGAPPRGFDPTWSIQSLPTMMLCTVVVTFFHV